MEVVGDYLHLERDSAIFAYFRSHYAHCFPALLHVHRTSLVRQAANLWQFKERIWQYFLAHTPHNERFALIDNFALPVVSPVSPVSSRLPLCCHRFRGKAAYGKNYLTRQTFYDFRANVCLC